MEDVKVQKVMLHVEGTIQFATTIFSGTQHYNIVATLS